MKLQTMYIMSYVLLGCMCFMMILAAVYGITNNIRKAYQFRMNYKNLSTRKERMPKEKPTLMLEDGKETVLLDEQIQTQVLIQEETFYGNDRKRETTLC